MEKDLPAIQSPERNSTLNDGLGNRHRDEPLENKGNEGDNEGTKISDNNTIDSRVSVTSEDSGEEIRDKKSLENVRGTTPLLIGERGVQPPDSSHPIHSKERETGHTPGDNLEDNCNDVDNEISQSDSDENAINYFEDMRNFERQSGSSSDGTLKGPMGWIASQISQNVDPERIISQIMPGVSFPQYVDPMTLWKVVWEILTEPKPRCKLDHVSTLENVVKLIASCKKIIILTGAGVSVSCGIPDFRSRDGIYARLSKDFPDLPDPQSMFDIHYFRRDQRPFFKFAKEIYPGKFKPSLSHRFIAALDRKKKLLHNYTQNIDTLEQVAGIERVIQCHGSFATASCTNCKYRVNADVIQDKIFNQIIPKCPNCPEDENILAVMKPDIIFFGEGLPNVFYEKLDTDKTEADLLIVIGSSLKVRPVALIPDYVNPDVPQILINREPLNHFNFDVELLGNCDDVICEICRRLGEDWSDVTLGHDTPPLDKEAILKLLESLSDSDGAESDVNDENDVSVESVNVKTEKEIHDNDDDSDEKGGCTELAHGSDVSQPSNKEYSSEGTATERLEYNAERQPGDPRDDSSTAERSEISSEHDDTWVSYRKRPRESMHAISKLETTHVGDRVRNANRNEITQTCDDNTSKDVSSVKANRDDDEDTPKRLRIDNSVTIFGQIINDDDKHCKQTLRSTNDLHGDTTRKRSRSSSQGSQDSQLIIRTMSPRYSKDVLLRDMIEEERLFMIY
eukprot:gene12682-13984_t